MCLSKDGKWGPGETAIWISGGRDFQVETTARAPFGLEEQPQLLRLHQKGRGLDHEEDMGIDSQWDGPDTLDPWITQVWIVQVHLHGNFFHEKCMSPHTIVLHNWRLAKSRDGEPQTWRTYTVIHRFPTMLRTGAPTSGLFKGHNCSCLSGFQKICLGMTYSMASITSSP